MCNDSGYTEDAVACAVLSALDVDLTSCAVYFAENSGLYGSLLRWINSHDLTRAWPVFGATN